MIFPKNTIPYGTIEYQGEDYEVFTYWDKDKEESILLITDVGQFRQWRCSIADINKMPARSIYTYAYNCVCDDLLGMVIANL